MQDDRVIGANAIEEMERLIHDAGFKSARRRQDYSIIAPISVAAA